MVIGESISKDQQPRQGRAGRERKVGDFDAGANCGAGYDLNQGTQTKRARRTGVALWLSTWAAIGVVV
jgi:hypothetical protein